MIKFLKEFFQCWFSHKWTSCPEDLVDDMGCFEYQAVCINCGEKAILGGTLHPVDLGELQFKRRHKERAHE